MAAEQSPLAIGELFSRAVPRSDNVSYDELLDHIIVEGVEQRREEASGQKTERVHVQGSPDDQEWDLVTVVAEGYKILLPVSRSSGEALNERERADFVLAQMLNNDRLTEIITRRYEYTDYERAEQFRALQKTQSLKHALLSARGGCHTSRDIANLVGLTHGAIRDHEKKGKVFAVESGARHLYPFWQYSNAGKPHPVIQDVLRVYNPDNKFELMAFFLNEHEATAGAVPVDLLEEGRYDDVLYLAQVEAAQDEGL